MESKGQKNDFSKSNVAMSKLKGLGETYYEKMWKHRDKIAFIIAETAEEHTYGSILQKSISVANCMRARGIQPNDVVSICSYNTAECYVAYYAGLFVGAVWTNFDPALPAAEAAHLLAQVRPKIIFVVPEAVQLMEGAMEEIKSDALIVVFGQTPNHLDFEGFSLAPRKGPESFFPHHVEELNDTALILFSSGTTGLPKGICLSHRGILGCLHNVWASHPEDTVSLVYANLYWILSVCATANPTFFGGTRVLCRKFDPVQFWDLIEKYKIRYISTTIYHLMEVCKDGRPLQADTSSLHTLLTGGAILTEKQMKILQDCFPDVNITIAFGMTETNGILMFCEMEGPKRGSIGKASPMFALKVIDLESDEILGPHQKGELLIKSDFLMKGYHNQDSSHVWDAEGFLKTGDVAYYDSDGFFYVVDRIKQLLKYKMWHISPAKLENILGEHPAVESAVVLGVPHEIDGDHPVALVALNNRARGGVSEEEIRKFVDDRVGDQFKLRGGVRFVESFPVTPSNKINRFKLKKMMLNGEI